MAAHTFTAALDRIAKDQPGVSNAHVATASGKKRRSFAEIVAKLAYLDAKERKRVKDGKRKGEAFERLDEFDDIEKAAQPRALKAIDADNSHTPFPHDAGAFANMRPDQVPRFLGALTDIDAQEDKTVRLNTLVAMQDRVKHAKVAAMQASDVKRATKPLVVRMGGKNYIADGHHGLAAAWLNGDNTAEVKFKDLSPRDQAVKSDDKWTLDAKITKLDEDKRLAFGFFSVVEKNGEPVVDSEGDRIAPDEIEKAAYGHVLNARIASDSHERMDVGKLIESCVFTPEKTAAMVKALAQIGVVAKIDIPAVAWWGGYHINDDAVWKAVKSGALPSFSIGGTGKRTLANGQ